MNQSFIPQLLVCSNDLFGALIGRNNSLLMGDSSQLTPLSIICKQPGPVICFPRFLSLASSLSIASFVWETI